MTTDIVLFLVGIVVGGMNAIAGGGMLLGFPVLLAFGLPALIANATSNIIILPGQLTSAYGYRKYLRTIPRSYLLLLVPCLLGATAGALILRSTSSDKFQHLVPVLILLAVLLFIFQPLLHFHLHRHLHRKKTVGHPPLWLAIALLPLALYGGYFGAGFGFVMLAFLGFTDLKDIHQMNGLKNLTAAVIAIASIACLYSAHLIDWKHGLAMAAGNFIGGFLGASLSQKISSHAIRIFVILSGIVTVGYLFIHNRV